MKLYLSADIEGTCGIVNWDETKLECEFSQHYRTQMSKEITAACDGATQSGVHEILVKDAHDSGRNINPNILPENVKILRGWTKDPLVMMAGIDESFDACIFTGYHSGATCNGNPLSHTMDIDYDYFKINQKNVVYFTFSCVIYYRPDKFGQNMEDTDERTCCFLLPQMRVLCLLPDIPPPAVPQMPFPGNHAYGTDAL